MLQECSRSNLLHSRPAGASACTSSLRSQASSLTPTQSLRRLYVLQWIDRLALVKHFKVHMVTGRPAAYGRSRSFLGIIPDHFSQMTVNDPLRSLAGRPANDRLAARAAAQSQASLTPSLEACTGELRQGLSAGLAGGPGEADGGLREPPTQKHRLLRKELRPRDT